eukprot:m.883485 g.883485  ORF g.883485 m.883485 type:complete len:60 (+) comp23606_c2_seq13:3071-3250(+)
MAHPMETTMVHSNYTLMDASYWLHHETLHLSCVHPAIAHAAGVAAHTRTGRARRRSPPA